MPSSFAVSPKGLTGRFGEEICNLHTRIFADYAFLHEAHPDPAKRTPIPADIQKQLLQWLDEGSIDPWACWWTKLLDHSERQRPLIGFIIRQHFSPETPLLMEVAQHHFDWHHPEYRRYWMHQVWSPAPQELKRLFEYTPASPNDCFAYRGNISFNAGELLEQRKTWAIEVKSYLHEHYPDFDTTTAAQKDLIESNRNFDVFKGGWTIVFGYGGMIPTSMRSHPTFAPLAERAEAYTGRVLAGLVARAEHAPLPDGAIDPATLSQKTLFPLANVGRLGEAFHPQLWRGREQEALALITSLPRCMQEKLAIETSVFIAISVPPAHHHLSDITHQDTVTATIARKSL